MIERLDIDSAHWLYGHADHLARYEQCLPRAKGARVLDCGTGPGYGAAMMALAGASEVVAIDISEEVVSNARNRFGKLGIHFCQDDAETLCKVQGSFDIVCSFENIEHLEDADAFLKQMKRVLKPDGVLMVSTPDKDVMPPQINGKPSNPYHHQEWSRSEFESLLSHYFETVDFRTQVRRHSLTLRQRACQDVASQLRNLNEATKGLLQSPFLRALLRIGRALTGKGPIFHSLDEVNSQWLSSPAPSDYPIVPTQLTDLYGTSWCHFCICSNAK